MKDNRTFKLFAVVLVIALICILSITGLGPENARIIKGVTDIRTGIDIRGGISAIMEPVYDDGSENHDVLSDLASARAIIEKRLDAQGIYDKTVNVDATNERLIIDIPWATNETEFDPRKALDELGSTGQLTFQEVKSEEATLPDEDLTPSGVIVLTGDDVANAQAVQNNNAQYVVELTLKDSGVTKFSEATKRLVGQRLAIFIDDMCISAPNVNTQITSKNAVIEGNFNYDSAKDLADKIRFGALPCKLEAVKVDSISAQLGQGALEVAVNAGIVGFILVCLFMLLYYRLPGLTAIVALSGLLALQIFVLSNLNISVTLPGIGGIILSIGMSVDANVIIFERIKEELRAGKTLRASIDAGFKRAFVAILDSNVTSIITAVILYAMGTGPIRGFGVTLFFGVLFSFLSAITASKLMLQGLTAFSFAKNKWLYGVSNGGKKA